MASKPSHERQDEPFAHAPKGLGDHSEGCLYPGILGAWASAKGSTLAIKSFQSLQDPNGTRPLDRRAYTVYLDDC